MNIRPYVQYGNFFVFGCGERSIVDIFEHLFNKKLTWRRASN